MANMCIARSPSFLDEKILLETVPRLSYESNSAHWPIGAMHIFIIKTYINYFSFVYAKEVGDEIQG